jgi:hypothetical protein
MLNMVLCIETARLYLSECFEQLSSVLRRNDNPEMLFYILQYWFVSPLHLIPQLIKFLPSERYLISLNSDTVNIGRLSLFPSPSPSPI